MSAMNLESRTSMVIVKPILYGNTAKHFGSKRDSDGHTHKWTLYVRSLNNEDMSSYINRVQFRLHETYPNNIRVVNKPPFEIEESGWGEFETQLTIFFCDPNERPVTFYHHLRLFSTDPDVVVGKNLLVNEFYDELVFQEPSELMVRLLTSVKSLPSSTDPSQTTEKEYLMKKAQTVARIKNARQCVRSEIQELTERLRVAQENLKRIRQKSIDNMVSPGAFTALPHDNVQHDVHD